MARSNSRAVHRRSASSITALRSRSGWLATCASTAASRPGSSVAVTLGRRRAGVDAGTGAVYPTVRPTRRPLWLGFDDPLEQRGSIRPVTVEAGVRSCWPPNLVSYRAHIRFAAPPLSKGIGGRLQEGRFASSTTPSPYGSSPVACRSCSFSASRLWLPGSRRSGDRPRSGRRGCGAPGRRRPRRCAAAGGAAAVPPRSVPWGTRTGVRAIRPLPPFAGSAPNGRSYTPCGESKETAWRR